MPKSPDGLRAESVAAARLLSMQQVEFEYSLHRTRVYGLIRQGQFPRPIKIGRTARWVRAELDQWVAQLAAEQSEKVGGAV
jgi:prophage regulatory protein